MAESIHSNQIQNKNCSTGEELSQQTLKITETIQK